MQIERLRKKSTLERQQDALNEAASLVQDCNDWLSFERLNPAECYTNGRLDVALECRARPGGEKFILVIRAGRPGCGHVTLNHHVLPIEVPEHKWGGPE